MTKLKLTLAALVFVVAACGTSAETERKLAELEQANAQRDSLMQEVALSSRLLSDINVEIAKVKVRGRLNVSSESPVTASSDTLIAKLRYVVTRVRETESQLSQSRERIKDLTSLSDSLRATLDSTASNLQAVIATQKQTIDLLTEQVNTLSTENVALRDSLSTGYYVIGTRAELKKKGILTEQGGGRVLFILWRTGKTLLFFFSSRRRHTRSDRDWSSDVCSSDLVLLDEALDAIAQLGWHLDPHGGGWLCSLHRDAFLAPPPRYKKPRKKAQP